MTPAYKILAASEWAAVPPDGAWDGSDVDRADGFIHLSTGDQLYETAAKHYAGQGGLMILTLDADHPPLEALIRWEPSRGGSHVEFSAAGAFEGDDGVAPGVGDGMR